MERKRSHRQPQPPGSRSLLREQEGDTPCSSDPTLGLASHLPAPTWALRIPWGFGPAPRGTHWLMEETYLQVCHTVQGERGLTQRLAVLREIWEGFSEEAASELRSEGSKAPSPGNQLAGGERRLGGPSSRKYSMYNSARREQGWYTEAGASCAGGLPP